MKASFAARKTWSFVSFAFFWCARTASALASQMVAVAVGWQIYEITGSALALGLIGLVQFVPMVSLMLIAGHIADQHDRRRIAATCQTIEGIMVLGIVSAIALHVLDARLLYAAVFVVGTCRAFEGPAQTSLLPNLVPREILQKATGNSIAALRVAQLAGPAVGGLIYAFSPIAVYAITALLMFTAAICISLTRPVERTIRRAPMNLETLLAGVRYVAAQRVILGAISLDLFAVLMGGATALLPIYARDILSTGPWGLGLLRAAPAVGAVIVTLSLGRRPLLRWVGPTLFATVAAYGVTTIGFAVSKVFAISFVMLALSGLFDGVSQVIRHTLLQLETPDELRGRVTAVNSLFTNSSGQLGELESGLVAAWLGAVPSVVIGGAASIIIAAAWMLMFPEITRINSFDELKHTEVRAG
jgi:MFS family permease